MWKKAIANYAQFIIEMSPRIILFKGKNKERAIVLYAIDGVLPINGGMCRIRHRTKIKTTGSKTGRLVCPERPFLKK